MTDRRVNPNQLYSVNEVAAMSCLSEAAIRRRMDRGTLGYVTSYIGKRGRRMIPGYDLLKAGLGDAPRMTRTDRGVKRLLTYLRAHPGEPLSQFTLARHSELVRQQLDVAMATLLALGCVRKSEEPTTRNGAGRSRIVWYWVGN